MVGKRVVILGHNHLPSKILRMIFVFGDDTVSVPLNISGELQRESNSKSMDAVSLTDRATKTLWTPLW